MGGTKNLESVQCEYRQRDLILHCKIPVERHFIKKNNRNIMYNSRTKKPFLGKSTDLVRAENHLIWEMRSAALKANIMQPISFDVWCVFLFHYPRHEYFTKIGARKKTLGDLSNHYQIIEDCLEKAGILDNDNLIQAHDWSRILVSTEMAIEIFIFNYGESLIDKTDPVFDDIKKIIDSH
jgi:Holliday junction resolvase RusA-like endonuclease